ncbi:ribose-phosphate diphosphokinase [Candidatus Paracaedibacter symbiosus]|uniref:ribose-phosphate diphosphokinase n=1 Tax=Candidatus Paracaedibacter symbiosus TaxID=244582 RepID=UPI0018DDE239|nr:ribose-phosphate diphosphokinase [Candidatus Paracaedibacter symbiosus]
MAILITSTPQDALIAKHLSQLLETSFASLAITTYASGEFYVEASEILTGQTVILFHHTSFPLSEGILKLLLSMNAIRHRKPERLIVIVPYLPYSRQDRSRNSGSAIGAKVVAQILETSYPDTLMVLDIHSLTTLDHFNFPTINLTAASLIAEDIKRYFKLSDICLISPDAGGIGRVQKIAELLDVPYTALSKERLDSGDLIIRSSQALPSQKTYIFVDDMIDTGSTLLVASQACRGKKLHVYATHGLFSSKTSFQNLTTCFESITVTDSLPQHYSAANFRIIPCWDVFVSEMKLRLLH